MGTVSPDLTVTTVLVSFESRRAKGDLIEDRPLLDRERAGLLEAHAFELRERHRDREPVGRAVQRGIAIGVADIGRDREVVEGVVEHRPHAFVGERGLALAQEGRGDLPSVGGAGLVVSPKEEVQIGVSGLQKEQKRRRMKLTIAMIHVVPKKEEISLRHD